MALQVSPLTTAIRQSQRREQVGVIRGAYCILRCSPRPGARTREYPPGFSLRLHQQFTRQVHSGAEKPSQRRPGAVFGLHGYLAALAKRRALDPLRPRLAYRRATARLETHSALKIPFLVIARLRFRTRLIFVQRFSAHSCLRKMLVAPPLVVVTAR